MGRQLIASDEGTTSPVQHTTPCSDCPFARTALPGWLGSMSVEEWIQAAHGESLIDCHVIVNQQCAGAAIYRANVCKLTIDKNILRLRPDRTKVFASLIEFKEHHNAKRRRKHF
jgi:hypothetical protein